MHAPTASVQPLCARTTAVGEVMQRDHGCDPLLAQLAEHVAVVTDLPGVEFTL